MSGNVSNISPQEMFLSQLEVCMAHEVLSNPLGWNKTYVYPNDFAEAHNNYNSLHIVKRTNT